MLTGLLLKVGFATKAMATTGGVGSCNLNYGSSGVGIGYLVYKFALGPAVSVSVSPTASSYTLGSTNPNIIQGLISLSPLSSNFSLNTTDPTILGQSITLEIFTDLGGAMALASYVLVYDDENAEIASTGNYTQGTGIEITNVINTIGNMWTADDILFDFVAVRTIGSVSVFDSDDIKICTWTFSPALEIGPVVEYYLEWPDNGIEFPSPLWITPSASSVGISTTNPIIIKGSIEFEPNISSFGLNTTNPTIPALPTLITYPTGTPSAASYILILDNEENEIASTGEYIQGTGLILSNVTYSDNRLYADDLSVDLVSATFFYLDLYDSDDVKIARWTTGDVQVITNSTFTFLWPDNGVFFQDYVLDVWPEEILFAIDTISPTVLYGSTSYAPVATSIGLTSTDPYVIETLAGSVLLTPNPISLGLDTKNPDSILGSLTLIPNISNFALKTKFYSGVFYLTPLRRSIYGNTISRGSY